MGTGGIGNCWYTVFIGVRFLIDEDGYDQDKDPRVVAATKQGLTSWTVRPRSTWEDADDEIDESNIILLIGKRLALVGDGNDDSTHVSPSELLTVIAETKAALKRAKISEKPELWAHCDIDLGD